MGELKILVFEGKEKSKSLLDLNPIVIRHKNIDTKEVHLNHCIHDGSLIDSIEIKHQNGDDILLITQVNLAIEFKD